MFSANTQKSENAPPNIFYRVEVYLIEVFVKNTSLTVRSSLNPYFLNFVYDFYFVILLVF